MISYLRGKIKFKEDDHIILDVSGIGFKIFCSRRDIVQFSPEKEVGLFVYLYRTQITLDLYGFLTKEEEDFFETLVDLPGIGPKAAMIIISIGPLEKLKEAIETGDEKFFEKVPGIGQKRIQKIILELSGKISKEVKKSGAITKTKDEEVLNALVNLGFSRAKARGALIKVSPKITEPEEKVREALKILGR